MSENTVKYKIRGHKPNAMPASQSFSLLMLRPTDKRVIIPARVIDSHEELEFLPHNRDKNIFGTQRIYRAPVEFPFSPFL